MNRGKTDSDRGHLREQYLQMTANALVGYVMVEFFVLFAKFTGLTTLSYWELLTLAAFANTFTAFFLAFIYFTPFFTAKTGRIVFFCELSLYLLSFGIAVFILREIRTTGLVFALIAVASELPYTTAPQSIMISMGSVVVYSLTSIYAIVLVRQPGSLGEALFYNLCFIPPLLLMAYVARQMKHARRSLLNDRNTLRSLNAALLTKNTLLEEYQARTSVEMELAGSIQKSLFPRMAPQTGEWDIAYAFRPVSEVSGDLFDFYQRNGSLRGVSLFDVSGHGVSAGLITMIVKPVLFRLFTMMEGQSLSAIVRRAAEIISNEISQIDSFATGIMLRFDPAGEVEYVNLGHPDLLKKTAANGLVRPLTPGDRPFRGLPIGMPGIDAVPRALKFSVAPGDTLLIATDGLIHSFNDNEEIFGQHSLVAALESAPSGAGAEEVLGHIMERHTAFIAGRLPQDDIIVIVARRL